MSSASGCGRITASETGRRVVRRNYISPERLLTRPPAPAAGVALSSADYNPAPVETFLIDENLGARHSHHEKLRCSRAFPED
jgi:hypothetical protein